MSAIQTKLVPGLGWDRRPAISDDVFAGTEVPLAGFYSGETGDLDEVSELVAWMPCAGEGATFFSQS